MTRVRPLVFVVYAEITAPVVRAQTFPLVAALRAAGRPVDAAVFTTPRRLFQPSVRSSHAEALRALQETIGREPYCATHAPGDRGFERLGRGLAAALRSRHESDAVLVCRQPRAALIALAARAELASLEHPPRVVLDLRGLRDVEYLLTLGRDEDALTADEAARLRAYREQERDAVNGADGVITVSSPMAQTLGLRYGTDPSRITVIPNHARPVPFAEDLRGTARGELGITGSELLIAYCGTLAAWQMAEESALLVRALRERRPDARLMYLTPDAAPANEIVKRLGLERALVRSALQEEVPRFLCAADYGLLLRQASPVNRVACPVKWGEYLACGVRPILTPGIGDQSQLAMSHDLGVVVSPDDLAGAAQRLWIDIDSGTRLTREGRDRRRAYAAEHLTPERAAAQVIRFIDALE